MYFFLSMSHYKVSDRPPSAMSYEPELLHIGSNCCRSQHAPDPSTKEDVGASWCATSQSIEGLRGCDRFEQELQQLSFDLGSNQSSLCPIHWCVRNSFPSASVNIQSLIASYRRVFDNIDLHQRRRRRQARWEYDQFPQTSKSCRSDSRY